MALTGDGGGQVKAALRPYKGSEQVARFLAGIARTAPPNGALLECMVNGQPGLVGCLDGEIVAVYTFEVTGERITRIWSVLNPEKLQLWRMPRWSNSARNGTGGQGPGYPQHARNALIGVDKTLKRVSGRIQPYRRVGVRRSWARGNRMHQQMAQVVPAVWRRLTLRPPFDQAERCQRIRAGAEKLRPPSQVGQCESAALIRRGRRPKPKIPAA